MVKLNNSELEKKYTSEASVMAACGSDGEIKYAHCLGHSWWLHTPSVNRAPSQKNSAHPLGLSFAAGNAATWKELENIES